MYSNQSGVTMTTWKCLYCGVDVVVYDDDYDDDAVADDEDDYGGDEHSRCSATLPLHLDAEVGMSQPGTMRDRSATPNIWNIPETEPVLKRNPVSIGVPRNRMMRRERKMMKLMQGGNPVSADA